MTDLTLSSQTEGALRFGPLGNSWVHLCIDMQRMFAEQTEWHTPWMARVLPFVISLVELDPARTVFTRFIPARNAEEAQGTWRRYYDRWSSMTLDHLDPELVDILPELQKFVPPAQLEDKMILSPWARSLDERLRASGIDTLIISGAETEVCVLAAVMGAIDRGYRVIIVSDAVCSGADTTHDAMLEIYSSRFGMQVETVTTAELIAARLERML
ncbi:MAG TPA: cysteine hydrolase [Ramlibacter sp.]